MIYLLAIFILLVLVAWLDRIAPRARGSRADADPIVRCFNESQLASFCLVKAEAILRYRMQLLRRR
jgi:hypothetical protein